MRAASFLSPQMTDPGSTLVFALTVVHTCAHLYSYFC